MIEPMNYDITILTDQRYVNPSSIDEYTQNVLKEDLLVQNALEELNFKVHRTNWDDPNMDWAKTRYILFRTTWDYFDRFEEFSAWLEKVSTLTQLINQKDLIYWNIDKHYLLDLEKKGVRIPPTFFIETGDDTSLKEHVSNLDWEEFILKPAISGAARHTYRFKKDESSKHEEIFASLISKESMLLQEYQKQITTKGEVAYMVFGGKFSHAIIKKAKAGDFRVQDDFGGTIADYIPNQEEIDFIENAFSAISPTPLYARVDVIWDNLDQLSIGEIELIEPELWFRNNDMAAGNLARAIQNHLQS